MNSLASLVNDASIWKGVVFVRTSKVVELPLLLSICLGYLFQEYVVGFMFVLSFVTYLGNKTLF